jgi:hypothetical protein
MKQTLINELQENGESSAMGPLLPGSVAKLSIQLKMAGNGCERKFNCRFDSGEATMPNHAQPPHGHGLDLW